MNGKAILIPAAAAALLAGGAAQAGDIRPSFDCAKASTTVEKLICEDEGLAALDWRMSNRFSASLTAIQRLDAGSADAQKTIWATQRGWIKGRDECWKADNMRDCVASEYLRREGELVATWMLEEPVAVAGFVCEDNPANEIYAYFFDTELPAVRLEYGDTIDTGSLSPTASGSRYDASFGRYIWVKGEEATVAWDEGAEMTCVLRK